MRAIVAGSSIGARPAAAVIDEEFTEVNRT